MATERSNRGDGSIYPIDGGRYRVQVDYGMVGGRRVRKTRVFSPPDALRKARTGRREMLREAADGVLPSTATTGEWVLYWLDHVTRARPATKDSYRSKINRHIAPTIGRVPLQRLRPDHVRLMQDHMAADGLAPNTVRQTHAILSAALRVAVDEGRLASNPAAVRSVAVAGERNPHQIVSLDDSARIVAGAQSMREASRLLAALWLGLRQSEALGLHWSDVFEDGPTPHVRISQAARRVKGAGMVLTPPKSETSRRSTPMSPAVATIFHAWRLESGGVGPVWASPTGGLGDPRADARLWADALARVGVSHVALHGARGTAATIMLMDSPLHVVARFLGHSNPMVTLAHYAHAMDAQLSGAADALERRMLDGRPALTPGA